MPLPRTSRVKLVWGLELALGLELYACAVLALHARGLRATPLLASPGLVIPALVIPPVFYVLVGLVSVRPRSLVRVMSAVGAMCGVHALLVAATGALFVIPDLVDYGSAVAFSLWGSPAVTMLQLTAAPLVLARLRPLLLTPRAAPRPEARAAPPQRRAETPPRIAPPPAASPAQREKAVVAPTAPPAQRPPAVTSPTAAPAPREPIVASPPAAPAARTPVATPAAGLTQRAPAVIPPGASPFRIGDSARTIVRGEAPSGLEPAPSAPARKAAPESAEPMVRVPFSRIADQLPVEMFVRGREGLSNTLRPGVSLLVPRRLLLPHLGEGLAPVKWEVVADQFPRDELMLTHDEIASRLPDGALLLPLDEVVPQIPGELLALSTPAADVYGIEEFPPPFQPHVPPPSETVAGDAVEAPELEAVELEEPEPLSPQALPEFGRGTDVPVDRDRTAEARRLATLLVPLMNGLRIGERDGAGTPLVTVVASTLSEDAVVGTAVRVAPFLTDVRLSEPVTQATLTGLEAAIVLTPFGSPDTGALLVTAVASRASLAWLERLSRSAAGGPRVIVQNGAHTLDGHREETALRATVVPSSVRELAGSLTAFGPVAPTVVCDAGGSFRVCLFLPGSLEALPLAEFARDLCGALEKAEIGRVASVILRLGTHRLILRSVESASGHATILVGGGPVARPGLARIELDRAATRLGAFGQG